MIGASVRPSGRLPCCKAVMICSTVQSPIPVSLSGVMFRPGKAPRPGISNATSEPPKYFVMSGLPKKYPGVWQSLQPPKVTRYLPRSIADSARAYGSCVIAAAIAAVATIKTNVLMIFSCPRSNPHEHDPPPDYITRELPLPRLNSTCDVVLIVVIGIIWCGL